MIVNFRVHAMHINKQDTIVTLRPVDIDTDHPERIKDLTGEVNLTVHHDDTLFKINGLYTANIKEIGKTS